MNTNLIKGKISDAIELQKLYKEGKITPESPYYTKEHLNNLYRYESTKKDKFQDKELLDFCLTELEKLDPPDKERLDRVGFNLRVEEEIQIRKKAFFKKARKMVAVFLAIVMPPFIGQVVGLAFGMNLYEYVVDNFNQVFGIDSAVKQEENIDDVVDYSFSWIPKGYELEEFLPEERQLMMSYTYIYAGENKEDITLNVRIFKNSRRQEDIQMNSGTLESFIWNGVEYQKFSNNENREIAWRNGDERFILYGSVTMETLKEIIEKNY